MSNDVFDNQLMVERYCQAHMTALGKACRTFHGHFLQIGIVDVFLESLTIASACNRVLRKSSFGPIGYE